MKRNVIFLSILGICAIALAFAYFCTLQKQNEAKAILITLAEVRLGVTNKHDFFDHMNRFGKYKSSMDIFSHSSNSDLKGVEYDISNAVIGKYSIFRKTFISISVYFDSSDKVYKWDVIFYNDNASVFIMDELNPPPNVSIGSIPRSKSTQWPESRALHQVNTEDLKLISTSCFTSWFGCNTSKMLLTGSN
jgi:hypothetical protein